jgi:hypothetical protein
MKLSTHKVDSVKVLFEEGMGEEVEVLQKAYREKLDQEYLKPNPFEGDASCTLLSEH